MNFFSNRFLREIAAAPSVTQFKQEIMQEINRLAEHGLLFQDDGYDDDIKDERHDEIYDQLVQSGWTFQPANTATTKFTDQHHR